MYKSFQAALLVISGNMPGRKSCRLCKTTKNRVTRRQLTIEVCIECFAKTNQSQCPSDDVCIGTRRQKNDESDSYALESSSSQQDVQEIRSCALNLLQKETEVRKIQGVTQLLQGDEAEWDQEQASQILHRITSVEENLENVSKRQF